MNQNGQKPAKEFRAGTICAAIWTKSETHDGRSVLQHNIRIQKRYRDERTGEWKTTSYFRSEDMPRLALVANRVFEHVTLKEVEPSAEAESK
jgi:hypothetical protein